MRPLETLIAVTLIASPALSRGQDSTAGAVRPAVVTTMAGVYTEQQAGRGETVYRNTCAACHDASDHTGATFKQNWNGRTAFDLFETIRTTMPNDDPGMLPREDYANIVAYLFKANRVPSGTKELPSDSTALKQMVIAVGDTISTRGGVRKRNAGSGARPEAECGRGTRDRELDPRRSAEEEWEGGVRGEGQD